MRLWHILHEALTETTLAQLIMSSYPQPNSMLYPQGIDHNSYLLFSSLHSYESPTLIDFMIFYQSYTYL